MSKEKYNKNDNLNLTQKILSIGIAILYSAIICSILLILFSFIFIKIGSVPKDGINILVLIISAIGAFFAGYFSLKKIKYNGIVFGFLAGFILFSIITLVGFIITREPFVFTTLIKFIIMTITGSLGGVLAVNRS